MLIDTTADRSTLQDPNLPTTSATVKAIGVGGTVCALPLTAEQTVQLGPLSEDHSFLIATSCPANLLGRDLLCKLRATITCSPEGLYLSVPTSVPEATVMALLATNATTITPTAPLVPVELSDIPEALWASASTETGLLKSAEPVYITYRTDVPLPRKMQYPLPKEAIEGIQPVLQQLLTQGIIKEATSPCNTPILPVKKPKPGPDGKPVYRFVHDLRLINAIVTPRAPVVPNPATILTAIPPRATYFTVIDLYSAFVSIPVHPDSQFLFAFTFDGRQYVWTCLPQGYRESPTIFSQYLRRDLDSLSLTMGSTLIQYVDDLLLCSTAKTACVQDTRILLFALAEKGHKVALSKLQFAQPEVVSVCHSTGQLWKHRGFLTSSGSQISHVALISALLEAIQRPAAVSVTHCKGHSCASDEVSKGNAAADSAARHAALCGAPASFPFLAPLLLQPVTPAILLSAQQTMPPAEVSRWKSIGCHLNKDNLYVSPDGHPVLPRQLLPQVSQALHLASHLGKGGLVAQMEKLFFAPGVHAAAKTVTAQCELCQQYNHQGAIKPQVMGHCKLPEYPFAVVQMGFMDLPPVTGLKHLLVLVDLFSGWVEAFPTRRADAVSVAKCLLKDIVPRFGIMTRLESDQGPHFTSQIIQHLAKALGIKQALHTPYHPQSSGKVERVNGLIKTQLAKLCEQTGLKWPEVLPIVLTILRNTPHRKHLLTPFEILFGRPLPIPLTSVDGFVPAKTSLMAGQDKLVGYCRMLQDALSDAWARVKDAQPLPLDTCAHSLFPGDFVCVKIHRRKHCLEPRWSAPA
ncbi:unnamed protein product [Natator depressus]